VVSENHGDASNLALDTYLDTMPELAASDMHIKVGAPILMRVAGTLRPLDMPPVTEQQANRLALSFLKEDQRKQLDVVGSVDLAYSTAKGCRVRVNIFYQRGMVSLAARYVNPVIPSFEDLMLPGETLKGICQSDAGLVIVAGATGSGKSTTLAAMIDYINHTRRCHILTLEDPIEYLFTDNKALISQREIGIDADSFENALKYALRADPDVILMGEMRDPDTVQTGLTAAETGHLVFGTLHAATAPQVIGRLLDLFPGSRQTQMRRSLVFNLRAVICQRLLRCTKKDRQRVPAMEVLLTTPPVRKVIDDAEDEKLRDVIVRSREDGMIDFTHSICDLIQKRFVTKTEGLSQAPNPNALQSLLDGLDIR